MEAQVATLKAAGCTIIQTETGPGTAADRSGLATVLQLLQSGDILVVTRMDRLARNIGDLQSIARAVQAKGAHLRASEQPIDTAIMSNTLFIAILDALAELKANEGGEQRTCKRAKGVRGRPRSVDGDTVRKLVADGLRTGEVATRLGVSRTTIYRAMRK